MSSDDISSVLPLQLKEQKVGKDQGCSLQAEKKGVPYQTISFPSISPEIKPDLQSVVCN